jgi:hypothetical protein
MKNVLLRLSLMMCLLLTFVNAFPQGPSALKQQIVLEVSTVTSKNYSEVKSSLSSISGITLLAFCEESRCFLLSYDPMVIESTDVIEKAVQQLDPSYKTKILTNVTVAELIDNCTKFMADPGGLPDAK